MNPSPDHIVITADPSHEPAPETEVEHPEFPQLEPGRVAAVLRRLVADALKRKEIEGPDAVDAMRWIDSSDAA